MCGATFGGDDGTPACCSVKLRSGARRGTLPLGAEASGSDSASATTELCAATLLRLHTPDERGMMPSVKLVFSDVRLRLEPGCIVPCRAGDSRFSAASSSTAPGRDLRPDPHTGLSPCTGRDPMQTGMVAVAE